MFEIKGESHRKYLKQTVVNFLQTSDFKLQKNKKKFENKSKKKEEKKLIILIVLLW